MDTGMTTDLNDEDKAQLWRMVQVYPNPNPNPNPKPDPDPEPKPKPIPTLTPTPTLPQPYPYPTPNPTPNQADCDFLQRQNLLDYSLLLGIYRPPDRSMDPSPYP